MRCIECKPSPAGSRISAEPDVRFGDGATTRQIDSASRPYSARTLSPCEAESDEVLGIAGVPSVGIWVDDDAQHRLCGVAVPESLGVELGRRAEYETALRTG